MLLLLLLSSLPNLTFLLLSQSWIRFVRRRSSHHIKTPITLLLLLLLLLSSSHQNSHNILSTLEKGDLMGKANNSSNNSINNSNNSCCSFAKYFYVWCSTDLLSFINLRREREETKIYRKMLDCVLPHCIPN